LPLKSSTSYALGSNSQPSNSQEKFLEVVTNYTFWDIAYESAGMPFWTQSTDNGSTWVSEGLFEPGVISTGSTILRSPTLFYDPAAVRSAAAWERVDHSGSTWNHAIKFKPLPVTMGYGEVTPVTIRTFATSSDQAAMPAATSNSPDQFLFLSWKDSSSIRYSLGIMSGYQWNFNAQGTLSSSSTAANPSVSCNKGTSSTDTVYVAWEEPGTTGGIWIHQGTFARGSSTITWRANGPFKICANSATAANSKPVVLIAPGGPSYGTLFVAWEHNDGAQSSINVKKFNPYWLSETDSLSFPTRCPNRSASGISMRADGSNITITWHVAGVGLAGVKYTNAYWSDQYIINSSALGRGALLSSQNQTSSNLKYISISGLAAPYTISAAPQSISSPTPSPVPALVSPANGAINVSVSPTLSWQNSFGASSYTVQYDAFADDPDFEFGITETTGDTSIALSNLTGIVYYWRVQAVNSNGESDWSPTWHFNTVNAPQIISLTVARTKNLDQQCNCYHPQLSWSGGSASYTVLRSEGSSTAFHAIATDVSGNSYTDTAIPVADTGNHGVIMYYKISCNGGVSNIVSIQSGVQEYYKVSIQKPVSTRISANYPNPFNPTTTLDLALASAGYVKMAVYNSLGQEIEKLVDGRKEEGYYSVKWNAGNAPSGIYIVRINVIDQSGNSMYQDVKKLMLIK
jgi:hypothetical protein